MDNLNSFGSITAPVILVFSAVLLFSISSVANSNDSNRYLELAVCELQLISDENTKNRNGTNNEAANTLTSLNEWLANQKPSLNYTNTELSSWCSEFRKEDYAPSDLASYAMGVSFYNKVLGKSEYGKLNLIDFMNGLLRAKDKGVGIESTKLDNELKKALDPVEASAQYLDVVRRDNTYENASGVFYKKIATGVKRADFSGCDRHGNKQHYVSFYRVDPIDKEYVLNSTSSSVTHASVLNDKGKCIGVDKNDVIRGWGLLLGKLTTDTIYDVLVPSDLAYGPEGLKEDKTVSGGQNLRFIMQLHSNR